MCNWDNDVTNLPIRDWNEWKPVRLVSLTHVTNLPIRDWNSSRSKWIVNLLRYEPSYKGLKPLTGYARLHNVVTNLPIRDWNVARFHNHDDPLIGYEPSYKGLKLYGKMCKSNETVTNLPIRDWNFLELHVSLIGIGYEPSYKGLKLFRTPCFLDRNRVTNLPIRDWNTQASAMTQEQLVTNLPIRDWTYLNTILKRMLHWVPNFPTWVKIYHNAQEDSPFYKLEMNCAS